MKRILITGKNSYIGNSFEKYVKKYKEYKIEQLDVSDSDWKKTDFSLYDVVFHVAAIVHQKESKKNEEKYYSVNRDLAIEIARKAKLSGVRQFIIMSSMSVYGKAQGEIYQYTIPEPKSAYGKSKAQADESIYKLNDENFNVAIVRPPMVYGKSCKGNFRKMIDFIVKCPVFFKIDNKRSVIYIDNLCEFIHNLIHFNKNGIFLPQNKDYVSTEKLAYYISEARGKRLINLKVPERVLKKSKFNICNKLFGDLIYEKIDYGFDYHIEKDTEYTVIKSVE